MKALEAACTDDKKRLCPTDDDHEALEQCFFRDLQRVSPACISTAQHNAAVLVGKDLPPGTGEGPALALGPAWTRGLMEKPQGERVLGSSTVLVYTEEQQKRLGVDEYGLPQPSGQPRSTDDDPTSNAASPLGANTSVPASSQSPTPASIPSQSAATTSFAGSESTASPAPLAAAVTENPAFVSSPDPPRPDSPGIVDNDSSVFSATVAPPLSPTFVVYTEQDGAANGAQLTQPDAYLPFPAPFPPSPPILLPVPPPHIPLPPPLPQEHYAGPAKEAPSTANRFHSTIPEQHIMTTMSTIDPLEESVAAISPSRGYDGLGSKPSKAYAAVESKPIATTDVSAEVEILRIQVDERTNTTTITDIVEDVTLMLSATDGMQPGDGMATTEGPTAAATVVFDAANVSNPRSASDTDEDRSTVVTALDETKPSTALPPYASVPCTACLRFLTTCLSSYDIKKCALKCDSACAAVDGKTNDPGNIYSVHRFVDVLRRLNPRPMSYLHLLVPFSPLFDEYAHNNTRSCIILSDAKECLSEEEGMFQAFAVRSAVSVDVFAASSVSTEGIGNCMMQFRSQLCVITPGNLIAPSTVDDVLPGSDAGNDILKLWQHLFYALHVYA